MRYALAGVAGFVLGTVLLWALDYWLSGPPLDDWQRDEHSV